MLVQRLITIRKRLALYLAVLILSSAVLSGLGWEAQHVTTAQHSRSLIAHSQRAVLTASSLRTPQLIGDDHALPRLVAVAANFSRSFAYLNSSILQNQPTVILRILSAGAPQVNRAPPVVSL